MYLSYYKLNKKPFQISTDPTFLWLGEKHQEALSILKYGIEDDKGFLLLTGDVGTGKTTLLNAFVNSLGDDIIVARVSDPGLTKLDFLKYIAGKFRMNEDFETKSEFLNLFTTFLEDSCQAGKKVLLIIDEAQHLTDEILEEIRLLSNIENQEKKLLNIFLVGQNEFNAALEKYKNRALRQRITINYTLYPLEKEETRACIEHRLGVAGVQKQLFTPEAIDAIHTLSEGFPRVINIICDHALFHGYQKNLDAISDEVIWKISKNLRFAHLPQGLGEPDFSDSSDDEWLEEVSEVPPLSPEMIQKASQPLPVLQDHLPETQSSKSYKYFVAIPIFITAFLLSGYLVLEEGQMNAIKDFFTDQSKETVAAPVTKPATETVSPPSIDTVDTAVVLETALEEGAKKATSKEIEILNDQKKAPPENTPSPKEPEELLKEKTADNDVSVSPTAALEIKREDVEAIREDQPNPVKRESVNTINTPDEPENSETLAPKASSPQTPDEKDPARHATKAGVQTITDSIGEISDDVPNEAMTSSIEQSSSTVKLSTSETTAPPISKDTTAEHNTDLRTDESNADKEKILQPPTPELSDEPPELRTPGKDMGFHTVDVKESPQYDENKSPSTEHPPTLSKDATLKQEADEAAQEPPLEEPQKEQATKSQPPPEVSLDASPEDPGAVIDWLLKSSEKEQQDASQ